MASTSDKDTRKRSASGPFAIAVATLAVLVGLRAADPEIVTGLRNLTFDTYQRLAPRPSGNQPIRVVGIDERALAVFGQWPWSRLRLAELSNALTELGAGAVVYSVLFAEPDRASPTRVLEQVAVEDGEQAQSIKTLLARLPDTDEVFAAALKGTPTILGFASSAEVNARRPALRAGFAYASANPAGVVPAFRGATLPLPVLEAAAQGIGGLGLADASQSGVVRRVPALFSDGRGVYPSIAVEALRVAQNARSILVRSTSAGSGAPTLTGLRVGDLHVPLTADGEVWMYFDRDRPERYVSAADLLDPAKRASLREAIEGHVVFVGATAAGLADHLVTPLGEAVPGVSVHAQLAEQILSGAFLIRPSWATGAELLLTILLGLAVTALLLLLGARFSFVAGGVIAGAALAGSWAAFSQAGYLIDALYPSLGALGVYLAVTGALHVTTDRDRRFVRRAFGQYLAPQLLAELEKAPHRMRLGGEVRPLTIMFMDIRAFTPISETLSAADLVHFLNTLLSPLSDAIQAEEGTIDKYIGDSIMAFWNAPLDVTDHARRACRAALRMRTIVDDLNAADAFGFRAAGRPELQVRIGVGINTGAACVGNMGSKSRFNYSAVGDAVNIAARIESCSKRYGVDLLISEETAGAVADFALLEVGQVHLRGKAKPTKLYALLGDDAVAQSAAFRDLAHLHGALLAALAAGDSRQAETLATICQHQAEPPFKALFEHFGQEARRLSAPDSRTPQQSAVAS